MDLIELLEECVSTLQPFAETVEAGARRWNGTAYVAVTTQQVGESLRVSLGIVTANCRSVSQASGGPNATSGRLDEKHALWWHGLIS